MPVPSPRKGEEEQDFISRCISDLTHSDPERDPKQIQAICFSKWREKDSESLSLHSDFQRILASFKRRFGDKLGQEKFGEFTTKQKHI